MRAVEYEINRRMAAPVVFLMPPDVFAFYQYRLRDFGGSHEEYLESLVHRYAALKFPTPGTLLTRYQARNPAMRRYAMRIGGSLYLKISQIAAYLGLSRCLFISWLIRQDRFRYRSIVKSPSPAVRSGNSIALVWAQPQANGRIRIKKKLWDSDRWSLRLLRGIQMLL